MSHSAISLVQLPPAYLPSCPWLDRSNRMLFADGCSSCPFNSSGFDADGDRPDPVAGLHLVAIGFGEAAR